MSTAPREYPDRPWVGIGCIVFREEAVLLVRRGKPPRIGQWSLPGGAQHVGERAEEAARRELREEASIEVGQMSLAYVFDAINQDEDGRALYHYTIIDFAAHWLEGEARAGDDVSEVAWALPHELADYDLTEVAHVAIAAARLALGLS
ncbi:MAG: NUDIX domain-containing protein [Alphaproteobacteria bacterium]|nr:NUDIX domain-containing protein [Alphaproteobacteria bacterium]